MCEDVRYLMDIFKQIMWCNDLVLKNDYLYKKKCIVYIVSTIKYYVYHNKG